MKIKMAEIMLATPYLGKLRNLGIITVLKAKKIGEAVALVQEKLDRFNELRLAAAKKYDVVDKEKDTADAEKWDGFDKEFQELLNEEHEFSVFPIEIPGGATGLTTVDIEKLERAGFITVKV